MTAIEETRDRIVHLAVRRFGKDAAALGAEDDLYAALGIDSMQAMELLTELENTLGVEIPDYELRGVTTFTGLAEVVARRL